MATLTGCGVIGYTDDTLVVAKRDSWADAIVNANVATACVIRRIRMTGLTVAPAKTEAVFMHNGVHGTPPVDACMTIEGIKVKIGTSIKYLGLVIDEKWRFREHFVRLEPRMNKVASSLSRLLPNLGGPKTSVRKLYTNVLHSMALYGAPVWAERMSQDSFIRTLMHRSQRIMAIRIARCYRTVSHRAATTLAGVPPIELLAEMYRQVYKRIRTLQELVGLAGVTEREVATTRRQAKKRMMTKSSWRTTWKPGEELWRQYVLT